MFLLDRSASIHHPIFILIKFSEKSINTYKELWRSFKLFTIKEISINVVSDFGTVIWRVWDNVILGKQRGLETYLENDTYQNIVIRNQLSFYNQMTQCI